MKKAQLEELLYQAIETELGGVQIYKTALKCVIQPELKEEWEKYLEQTKHHVEVITQAVSEMGLDPNTQTPGRSIVKHIGDSLVRAMEKAMVAGDRDAAQIVAGECVVLAETKDHLNWALIGEVAKHAGGKTAKLLQDAHDEVEPDENEHLYHSTGWTRELWINALGMPAVLPPPEEEKDVKTAIGAEKAKNARANML